MEEYRPEEKDAEGSGELMENIKDRIFIRVVNAGREAELLKTAPHVLVGDLAIIYSLYIPEATDEEGVTKPLEVTVTGTDLVGDWFSLEEFHRMALENSAKNMPAEPLVSLSEMFGDPEEKEGMYMLTNRKKHYGAAALFYPGMMEQIGEKFPEGYWILPSSVHEVIILPDNGKVKAEALQKMVIDVNRSQVEAKDFLSDSVYHYDPATGVFTVAAAG